MTKAEYELFTVIGSILKRLDHPYKERLLECLENVQGEYVRCLPPPKEVCPTCNGFKFIFDRNVRRYRKCEFCHD